jgi:hypothetical protein
VGNGPRSEPLTGLARNELMTASIKRAGLQSPFFARRTIFLATDVVTGASRSVTLNRLPPKADANRFYFDAGLAGGLTAGPLLLPSSPGILAESCSRTPSLRWSFEFAPTPVVAVEWFAVGPLLLPGLPGIPAPEF